MRAVSRCKWLLAAGALVLAPAVAFAQQAPATNNSAAPATNTVGPSDLQNFTLNGTVTRPADQPATTAPAKPEGRATTPSVEPTDQPASTPPATSAPDAATKPAQRAARTAANQPAAPAAPAQPQPAAELLHQSQPASSVTASLPSLNASGTASAAAPPADFAPPPNTLAPQRSFPLLPWLLAALVLAVGGGFLFWRSRTREAYAGGAQFDEFVAPEPVPAALPRSAAPPRAEPVPPPVVAPSPPAPADIGIVSSRLRPWVEIDFNPIRCILDDSALTVEFELELFNSGNAPARGVRVDAAIFNASANQDQEIGSFIANPVGQGEATEIPPLRRLALKTRVAIARDQVKAYEIAGKQVFLPVIAFNTLYAWGGGAGQTSTTYLLGRDTKNEKLGPFRLDLGPRIFRGIAARLLPAGLRQ